MLLSVVTSKLTNMKHTSFLPFHWLTKLLNCHCLCSENKLCNTSSMVHRALGSYSAVQYMNSLFLPIDKTQVKKLKSSLHFIDYFHNRQQKKKQVLLELSFNEQKIHRKKSIQSKQYEEMEMCIKKEHMLEIFLIMLRKSVPIITDNVRVSWKYSQYFSGKRLKTSGIVCFLSIFGYIVVYSFGYTWALIIEGVGLGVKIPLVGANLVRCFKNSSFFSCSLCKTTKMCRRNKYHFPLRHMSFKIMYNCTIHCLYPLTQIQLYFYDHFIFCF